MKFQDPLPRSKRSSGFFFPEVVVETLSTIMSETLAKIPTGMRYYTGPEARLRRDIENSLVTIFAGWTYEEITTPTVDYYSLFEQGMGRSQAHQAFRFSDSDGRMLALRPDVTSLVARAAATLFAERERPLRLSYVAPVFRQTPRSHAEWRREFTQIGCELIGANSSAADMEILAIICEVLECLDLDRDSSITLNDVEVFNGIAEEMNLAPALRDEMRALVDTRNTLELERFFGTYASAEDPQAYAQLIQLTGKRETLTEARRLITNSRSRVALDRLERLWSVIETLQLEDRFEIDLGDVSRLDYYTGLTFKVYVRGAGARVGSGGRYDGLTESFGRAEQAVGFVLELDALAEVLMTRGYDPGLTRGFAEVAPLRAGSLDDLFLAARKTRSLGQRVVIDSSGVIR